MTAASDPEDAVSRREFEARLAEVKQPPVVDPTENVLQLVAASMKRQDDLREMESKHRDAMAALEREHRTEVRELETKYRDAQLAAEARRLDALRAADKSDIALASARAEATAAALADRVATAATTLATDAGSKTQRTDDRGQNQWIVGLVLGLPAAILGVVALVLLVAN